MSSENGFVMPEHIFELEIMLFTSAVVLGVRACYGCSIAVLDSAVGHNVTAFRTIPRDMESTPVNTFARHDTHLYAFK